MSSPQKHRVVENKLILEEFNEEECSMPAFVTNKRTEDKKNQSIIQEKLLILEQTMDFECNDQESVV